MDISNKGPFEKRRLAMEGAFYAHRDHELLDRLKEQLEREDLKQALAEATGVENEEVLDLLVSYGARPETLAAVFLIPLIAVAWADGRVDSREREALVRAFKKKGATATSFGKTMLEGWLETKPDPGLFDAWCQFIEEAAKEFPPEEMQKLADEVIRQTIAVAEAAGSFLGITSGISPQERAVIDRVRAAFQGAH